MAERFNAPVLKIGDGKPSVGSNPTLSVERNRNTKETMKIYHKISLVDWMRYRIESQLFESISDMDKFTLFAKKNEATWRINTLNTLIFNQTHEIQIKK